MMRDDTPDLQPAPRGALSWHPDTLEWDDVNPDGTKYALLEGRRDAAGEAFTYAFFLPGGFFDPPHWHTADARICVLRGTLLLGHGEQFDDCALRTFEAGTYLLVPAGVRHFDGAREDTLILGTAVGPWSTHYVDPGVQPSAGTPRTAP